MFIFTSPAEMRFWADEQRAAGRSIGFVPTMGALHDGHLTLVASARERSTVVVVSVFVNPLQFDRPADFDGYPRPIDDDVAACRSAGVDAVYAPTAADMYPAGFQTRVVPGALAEVMEGPGRPGHFEGMLTVVTKLFAVTRPHLAVFGQKDYQQLRIVQQMATDLDLGVHVVGHHVVREPDGVAMSSRNVRLDPVQRRAAVCIVTALTAAGSTAARSNDVAEIVAAATAVIEAEPAAALEYVSVFDADTLEELVELDVGHRRPGAVRVATAVWFGEVRLIDNCDPFD